MILTLNVQLLQPAFASCVPLVDPRAFDVLRRNPSPARDELPWSLADDNGLLGVACTGLQVRCLPRGSPCGFSDHHVITQPLIIRRNSQLKGLSDVLQTVWLPHEFEAGTHFAYIKERETGMFEIGTVSTCRLWCSKAISISTRYVLVQPTRAE